MDQASLIGIFIKASSELLGSPLYVAKVDVLKPPSKVSNFGLFVISLTVPACELAPNNVPCGPGNTSTLSISATYTSRFLPGT